MDRTEWRVFCCVLLVLIVGLACARSGLLEEVGSQVTSIACSALNEASSRNNRDVMLVGYPPAPQSPTGR